jgi:dipeptidyl aminopeptidase/acylaminoacyl peptidase
MTRCRRFTVRPLLPFIAMALLASMGLAPQKEKLADEWLARPVDDRTFKTYLEFFTYDRHVPFDLKVIDTSEADGIHKEHLSFQSTPGVRVYANLYRLTSAAPANSPALVFLHTAAAGGKDSRPSIQTCSTLTRAGYTVLSFDLQYWGERATDLLTTYTEQEKHDKLYNQPSLYLSWVAQTAKDAGRAFDLLVEQRGVNPKRIGLYGASRGAILAPIVGAVDRRFVAVVIQNGGHFDALDREHLAAACPANYIGRISPRPLLMIHGTLDQDHVKETSVDPLYRLAKPPKEILWQETGHSPPTEKNQALLLQWLREKVK